MNLDFMERIANMRSIQWLYLGLWLWMIPAGGIRADLAPSDSVYELGSYRLLVMPAETLRWSHPVEISLGSQDFMANVSGMIADKTARPDASINELALSYQPERLDGERCFLTINGQAVRVNLPDWILIPAAQLADGPYTSWVSLSGHLIDRTPEKILENKKARIINYHPALFNTLLGLRLFQLIILIQYDCSPLLPLQRHCYPAGPNESIPDGITGFRNFNRFNSEFYQFQKQIGKQHRSHLITDYQCDIRFAVVNDTLQVSGDPRFFLWAFPYDNGQFSKKEMDDSLMQVMQRAFAAGLTKTPPQPNNEVLIDSMLKLEEEYNRLYRLFDSEILKGLSAEPDPDAKRYFLRQYRLPSLLEFYLKARASMEAHRIVPLTECDSFFQERSELIRSINPTVWDATVLAIRYAAFFRYCRHSHSQSWSSFIDSIHSARVGLPKVITPSLMIHRDSL